MADFTIRFGSGKGKTYNMIWHMIRSLEGREKCLAVREKSDLSSQIVFENGSVYKITNKDGHILLTKQ